MDDAPILRGRLAEADPVLSGYLEEATKIARNEWLPALPTNQGSSNAYPHLRNVAGYLEHVLLSFEVDPEAGFTPLTAGEIYVALLSVLFHDYGRLDPRSKAHGKSKGIAHGTLSEEHLRKHHAKLGIHTSEVAELVGHVARCHEFEPPESDEDQEKCESIGRVAYSIAQRSETIIDSIGAVRTPLLAALLALADQMDAAYTRSVPEYLTEEQGGVIGMFRRHIRGVCVDPRTKLIKTVMTLKDVESIGEKQPPSYVADHTGKALTCDASSTKPAQKTLNGLTPGNVELDWLSGHACSNAEQHSLKLLASRTIRLQRHTGVDGTGRFGKPTRGSQNPVLVNMPRFGPQAIAFGNMAENHGLLEQVTPVLARYGIDLYCWLVEIDDRLFRHDGRATFEPILSMKLLKDTANAMWSLATRIFGATSFSYEDVAAYMGDPNVWRVKVACRRVANAVAAKYGFDVGHPVPWTGMDRWNWHGQKLEQGKCGYVCLGAVMGEIEKLTTPKDD